MRTAKGLAPNGFTEQPCTPRIFTIGHSNKDILTFISLLQTVNVQTVVDCRTRPRSRWAHFNAVRLATHLASIGINYELRGHNLGGLAGNVDFDQTLDEMKERVLACERIALMCSEGKPQECHRGTILAPELEERGLEVEHLLYSKKVSSNEQLSANW